MPSLLSRLVPGYLRITRANRPYASTDQALRHIEQRRIRPRPYGPPRRLRSDVMVTVSDEGPGWPVYTVKPRRDEARGALIYLHGGGWVSEIAVQHWWLAAQIAAEARTTVVVPIYPLIPFGTAEPVLSAVADLALASTHRNGPTCLAGDSAGGQIALSAALLLRDEQQLVLPRTVLIAPALDLSLTNPEIDRVQPSDPWLSREGTRVFVEWWRGSLPVTDPRVSPLSADLHGLGPVTLFSGTRDILHPDARLFVGLGHAAGVDIDYHEGPGLVHVYPLTPTPEGREARRLIVDRVRSAVA